MPTQRESGSNSGGTSMSLPGPGGGGGGGGGGLGGLGGPGGDSVHQVRVKAYYKGLIPTGGKVKSVYKPKGKFKINVLDQDYMWQ